MKISRTTLIFLLIILISGIFLFKNPVSQSRAKDLPQQPLDTNQHSGDPTDESNSTSPVQSKIPHLRNRMQTANLQIFKETVARQALAFPKDYFLEALDYDKEVALTFDDGPDAIFTPQVLDVLKEYNVQATFFLTGTNCKRYPEIVRRIQAEGHAIGSHSYSHPDLRKLAAVTAYQTEILSTQTILEGLIGYQPSFYRPPYGAVTDEQIIYFAQHDLKTINWSIDSFDWDSKQNSVDEITDKIFKCIHEGAIILMHSAGIDRSNTVRSLPIIIETLREKGYQFKTIPEMLELSQS